MKLGFFKHCSAILCLAIICRGQVPDFVKPVAYATGGDSTLATAGDFNHDGSPDIVTFEAATQSLSFLFGRTDGTFASAVSRPLGFTISSLAAADLNSDGAADLVVASSGLVGVLLNAGDGSFASPVFSVAGFTANYVTTADINGDGVLDLAVAGTSGLAVFRGTGTGTFSAPVVMPTTLQHFWVGVADFNGDGKADLVADGSPGTFFAGNGDGTFAVPTNIPAIGSAAVVGDFDHNGKMDIAFLLNTFNQERAAGQQVSVVTGFGNGSFLESIRVFFTGPGTGQVAAGDFTGDGFTDVAIWLDTPARLYLMTDGTSIARGVNLDLGAAYGAKLAAATDVDGNGSKDVLLLNKQAITVVRNTHGNPSLLAAASVDRPSVTGGAQAQATVTLGGPAPASGATVILGTSDASVAYPAAPEITIPAGASAATFPVLTRAVAASSPVTLTATYNGVAQSATLTVVPPYTLTGVTLDPVRQYGGWTVQGTVTLSGPADSNATVSLTSSNTAAGSVPATVQVPAGATGAVFPVKYAPVPADTAVTITASLGGISLGAAGTVLRALDSVQLTRAEYKVSSGDLRIEATTTNSSASLSVWNAATGALIGTLTPGGGGKYTGSFNLTPAVLSVSVRSSLGGIATGPVSQK